MHTLVLYIHISIFTYVCCTYAYSTYAYFRCCVGVSIIQLHLSNIAAVYTHIPHEKLLATSRASNPSTNIDPGSLKIGFMVLIQNAGFVRDNGTN